MERAIKNVAAFLWIMFLLACALQFVDTPNFVSALCVGTVFGILTGWSMVQFVEG